MSFLLARASARFYARHPWQLALAIAGIGLGVAVYVGVDLANDSARRAFDLSAAMIRGATTHRLLAVGGSMPESHFVELVVSGSVGRAAPVIESDVAIGSPAGPRYTLLGIDPIEEVGFREYAGFVPGRDADFAELIASPGTVMIPAALAAELGAGRGATIELWIGGRVHRARVVGTVQSLGGNAESEPPILADIGTAQELLGRIGSLDRIDLVLDERQAAALGANLPAGTSLVPAGNESRALTEMTRAFNTNLTALGLLALVVGMFLIYATISFAIIQRRAVIGMLRAIGLGRRRLVGTFLIEALGIGVLGTSAGLVLGDLLARGIIGLVLQTIGDLSFAATLQGAEPSVWIYLRGAALGVGATVLAALAPALEAARAEPDVALRRTTLERTAQSRSRFAAWLAIPALIVAGVLLAIESRGLLIAFAALFLVLCAGALVIPAATSQLMRLILPVARRVGGLAGTMAVRGVEASLSRTGVATAALAVAVATVIGVGLMIGSFRTSLVAWLDTTLTADIYLTPSPDDPDYLSAERLATLGNLPGVRGLSLTRLIRVPTEVGELSLRAVEPGPDGWGIEIVDGDQETALRTLASSPSVLIAEPLAFRLGWRAGDSLGLPAPTGTVAFPIAGVFRDYNTTGSALVMARGTFLRHWGDERLTGVGVHLMRGVDIAAGARAVRAALGAGGPRLRTTEEIERLSLVVFDRTFKITEVLRLLAGIVAFLGVVSAVLAFELERAREHAILQTIGFSPGQLRGLIATQTGLLGLSAGVAAIPLGCVLAALLVYVINRRSFGWSMELVLTPGPLVMGFALAVGAALLAGVYPAARGGRSTLDTALRDE
jgi:putative ABC transport system permease protein